MAAPAPLHAPVIDRSPRRLAWVLVGLLTITTVVTSAGWFLSAREGRGVPPACYTLDSPTAIRFDALHGNHSRRSTFAVAESDTRVMLGYWQEVEGGLHTAEGYGGRLAYTLTAPLGDRQVVDPAGDPVPSC
jgi:hypothetical protein